MMDKILVVDDEKGMREFLSIMLKKEGYEVISAEGGGEAIDLIKDDSFDLVITDIKMPRLDGLTVLNAIKEIEPHTPVIMITAFAATETAVEAMKKGAYDYITKPFKIDEIRLIIKKALEKKRLEEENIYLKGALKEKYQFSNIIGKCEKMMTIYGLIRKVANSKSTILISGESGTGKELVAKAIHYNSNRRDMPFISVNCGAMPENLLESELFGHEKGAFTSADSDKRGLFEIANSGTFFLDEIGETPLSIQVKLLRVLQEMEFKRVGGIKDIKVDVRIIAATNHDLQEAVAKGRLREDLYYRLNVIPIDLPPLRERREDIPLLVDYFIGKFSNTGNKNIRGISHDALKILEKYDWQGNVRELENVIERAIVLETSDIIRIENLPDEIINKVNNKMDLTTTLLGEEEVIDMERTLDKIEKDLLLIALKKTDGVMNKAAKLLSLSLRSMRYRLQKHDIKRGIDNDKEDRNNL
ncbi:MAG: sigma-54-dependent Fis family transcriptional regulator [Nitrospinae bacterium]|nr:sigma-54-dependent Fis family transcriptional regulator [Nitrospinota bacterium]